MGKQGFFIKESEQDDIQRRIVNRRSDNSLIVRGCAGSGKSLLAFWKLHEIVSNNKGSVQIIVYTLSLKDYFVEGCRGQGIDPNLIDYWGHWRQNPECTDYILVDEAQDFSASDIAMFQRFAKKALLLYGDSSQQIFSFLVNYGHPPRVSMDDIQRITQYPTEQLVFNYRLPVKIAKVVEYVSPEHDDLVGRCKVEGSEKPYILKYASRDEQLIAVIQLIRSRGLDDVGVLVRKNSQAKATWQFLQAHGLNAEVKYAENGRTYSNLNFATSNPKVLTYHSAKGLQFQTVFIPECESSILTGSIEPLYVAMSRTHQSLFILYANQLPAIFQTIPRDLYETDIRAKETEVL